MGEKADNNQSKGFSLIELIVVITIMACLLGIVGVQVLPYIEKAREAKDYQVVSGVCTASVSAFAEHASTLADNGVYQIESTLSGSDTYDTPTDEVVNSIRELLNGEDSDQIISLIFKEFKSKKAKEATSISINYDAEGKVLVQLSSPTDSIFDPVSSK